MNYLVVFVLLFLSISPDILQPASTRINGYNLSKPDKLWHLPDELIEISGITVTDYKTVACVQDERGVVFFYDFLNSKIIRNVRFNEDGDYEDLVIVNKELFVLRSDGSLFQLNFNTDKVFKTNKIDTKVPSEDNEGVCYDADSKKLLIACKGDIKNDKYKNKRAVYSFELKSGLLSSNPFLVIDPKAIKRFVTDNKIVVKKEKKHVDSDDEEKDIKVEFRMSAIGIHPVTKKIFILCSSDYLLCVFNRDGKPENIELLDPNLFNKAEGITFFPNGDLLVSNEGEKGKPTLLKFNYSQNRSF